MQKKAFSMDYNTILANEWRYRKLKDTKGISPEVLVYAQKLINDPALQEQLISNIFPGLKAGEDVTPSVFT